MADDPLLRADFTTKRVELRPVRMADVDHIYEMATVGDSVYGWRYRGATPPPDVFARQLFEGVLAQYLVVDRAQGTLQGLVGLYNANLASQHVYAFVLGAEHHTPGRVLEGLLIMLDHAFNTWELRKVYFEVPEYNLNQFSGITRYTTEEGRLRNHERLFGRLWDQLILALYRDTWEDRGRPVLASLREGSGPGDGSTGGT